MTEPYWEPLAAGVPLPPVVNGQWIKGVGGAAVWTSILAKDVFGIGASTSSALSAANTDIAWPLGQGAHTLLHQVGPTGNAGSIRTYGPPLAGDGTRLVLRHNGSSGGSSSFAVLHWASGTGKGLYLASGRDRVLIANESIEFVYDGNNLLWMEVGRDVVVPYGTTLPAAPADGSEAILVDNVTNPTYQWRFRYNAQSSSAYKWEFVGGDPVRILTGTGVVETLASTGAFIDAPTIGPKFIVPRSGDYDCLGGLQAYCPSGATLLQLMVLGGTPGFALATTTPLAGYWAVLTIADAALAVPVGTDVRLRYSTSVAGGAVANRWLVVTPRRVS